MPVRLDELDLKILALLSRDGRIPLSRLAEKLRVPRTTVNSRLRARSTTTAGPTG
ncbi:MAG: AsnC family transcriptional regulator [Candidatus Korarchaeota archaeon]|nr:AsnC family transcriptional regulator [Candidatus Korarchaeota archaeon]